MTNIDTYYLLLKQIRIKSGLTQKQLAILIGEHQSYVSKYESGEQRIDLIGLNDICIALNIDLIDFIRALRES